MTAILQLYSIAAANWLVLWLTRSHSDTSNVSNVSLISNVSPLICNANIHFATSQEYSCSLFSENMTCMGIVPLRHLGQMPPSLQTVFRLWLIVYRTEFNSITVCITLNAKTGKICLVTETLCIHNKYTDNNASNAIHNQQYTQKLDIQQHR